MIVENKNGYKLLEYIPINEEDIDKYENITSAGVVFEVFIKEAKGKYSDRIIELYDDYGIVINN